MRSYSYNLTVGQTYRVPLNGDFIRVISSGDMIRITADNDAKEVIFDAAGDWWRRPKAFKQLVIETDVNQSVTLKIGFGEFGSDSVVGEVKSTNQAPDELVYSTTTIPVVLAEIVPANASQQTVSITPDVNSHIGAANVPLTPENIVLGGSTITFNGKYAIFAQGTDGAGTGDGTRVSKELFT